MTDEERNEKMQKLALKMVLAQGAEKGLEFSVKELSLLVDHICQMEARAELAETELAAINV